MEKVKNQICIEEMVQKAAARKYENFKQFEADADLLVENTETFWSQEKYKSA